MRDIFSFPREEVKDQILLSLFFSDNEEIESDRPPTYNTIPPEKVRAKPFLSGEVISFLSLEMFQQKLNCHLSRIIHKEF